jgi:hypothetical protein
MENKLFNDHILIRLLLRHLNVLQIILRVCRESLGMIPFKKMVGKKSMRGGVRPKWNPWVEPLECIRGLTGLVQAPRGYGEIFCRVCQKT